MFKNGLKNIPLAKSRSNILASITFDVCFDQISTLFNQHAPLHKLSKEEKSLKKNLLIHMQIQLLMKKRDKLFKLYCNESDPILKRANHNNFKIARNSVISKTKKSEKQYHQYYFQKFCTNIKKTWEGIKSVVILKAEAKTVSNSLTLNEVTITNKKSIVETFNIFLSILVPILRRKFQKQSTRLANI